MARMQGRSGTSIGLIARLGTLGISGLLWFAQPAAAQETLADALVGAYTHSGLLDQNRALLRAADEDVASAMAALRPIVSWQADYERTVGNQRLANGLNQVTDIDTSTLSIALIANWQIFDFGADSARIEAAKETVLATRAALLSVEQNVLLRAVAAFMTVREAVQNVSVRENNLRLLREELRAAQDRFEVGEVTRTDVAQAEARLAEARSGLATAQGNLVQAQEEYRNAVGRSPGVLAPPPPLPTVARGTRDIEQARARALRQHPDIVQAQRQVASAELLIKATELDLMPTLSLRGTLSAQENLDNNGYNSTATVGLRATGPIYQGGQLASFIRSAVASRDSFRGNLHVVRHNVEQDLGSSFATLMAATASLSASDQQIVAAQIAFDGIREEATLGARTTLDVLDAEQELLDAQTARIAAEADQYIAAYSVLAASGELTAERLRLPVRIYDPAAYYKLVEDAPAYRSKQGQALDRIIRKLD